MYKGVYAGKILRVDLTSQSAREEPVSEELAKSFLGGAGFAIKTLYEELKPGTPALGADNKLIFAIGPLTATGVSCSSRMAVAAKSPLTGAIGMALAGGPVHARLKNGRL